MYRSMSEISSTSAGCIRGISPPDCGGFVIRNKGVRMRLFEGTPWDRPPTCERCGKIESECVCPTVAAPRPVVPPEKQTARLTLEKRKKGKLVTVIRGLSAEANDLPALLVRLKNSCGAGGTLDGDSLEIQGDHLNRLRTLLGDIGYKLGR